MTGADRVKVNLNIEYNHVKLIIDRLNNSKTMNESAKKLDISERTLHRKLKQYKITKNPNTKIWGVDN